MNSQWRVFQFFKEDNAVEPGTHESPEFLEKLEVTCSCSGGGFIIFGDKEGWISFVKRNFSVYSKFYAHNKHVSHLQRIESQKVMISVGDDGPEHRFQIKIWKLDKVNREGSPLCQKVLPVRMVNDKAAVNVTCFAATEDLTCIAVGLESGVVLMYRGDFLRERGAIKPFELQHGPAPVTGIGYCEQGEEGALTLLVATTNCVKAHHLLARGPPTCEDLHPHGCQRMCAVMSLERIMFIGRADGVFEIGPDGRRGCYAFEGERKLLFWFKNYLVEVQHAGEEDQLNIYDVRNKFVAYSGAFTGKVTQIVSEWGEIFVLTADRKMLQLTEKDVQTKLEMLYKKGFYTVALKLAEDSKQFDASHRFDIHLKYGDHLYAAKRDFKAAMEQYIKIVERIEPSYVIRKYLDAQRIKNLTDFLEKLHEVKRANPDHTTLLLNCYTKLKDDAKLKKFVNDDCQQFDVETAIRVCRQANYHNYASSLAKKYKQHNWYLKMQIEDMGNYLKGLEYIRRLSFVQADKNMKKYGKLLMHKSPELTTKFLVELCTDFKPAALTEEAPGKLSTGRGSLHEEEGARGEGSGPQSCPQDFIHIFVDHPNELQSFLEHIIKHNPSCDPIVYNTLLELYLRAHDLLGKPAQDKQELPPGVLTVSDMEKHDAKHNEATEEAVEPTEEPVGPAGAREKQEELVRVKNHEAALALLQNPAAKYDDDHVLCLVQMFDFKPGMLFLYEKLKLYTEIVQHHMENNEYPAIMAACKKFGRIDPNLWVQVLSYFALKDEREDCHCWIRDVLNNIERERLLPPLLLVQILAQNPKTPLAVVKDYVTRHLQEERDLTSSDQKVINELRVETQGMRQEILKLQTQAKVFSDTSCSACSAKLDLPAMHFLCGHSFHQECVIDNELECPLCADANRKVMERRHKLEKSVEHHEQFFHQLESEGDGFGIVSEYFGRGLFNPPSAD